ncbi:hypothetical protein RGR602_CH02904 [Rhizobium gallicum bv. gallicum R602sp]|uniref:Uncharacterized protein n=1 Tax=Rhizobium gallicum bv. gallicum R602sp TaxID=1041138 RepID=A0A0B4X4Y0_9HYPH|nr:hypothetical protein RGR602_CH02904 [Rhizobium gallicum bv. gallicum R602sp]
MSHRTWGRFGRITERPRSIAIARAVHIAAVIALAFFPAERGSFRRWKRALPSSF